MPKFVTPTRPRVNLRDFEDQIVALRAIRWERNIPVNLPASDGQPERKDIKDALLCQVLVLTDHGVSNPGDTLVFYPVVAEAVEAVSPDWALGILARRKGDDYSYFTLMDLDEDEFEQVATRFSSAAA